MKKNLDSGKGQLYFDAFKRLSPGTSHELLSWSTRRGIGLALPALFGKPDEVRKLLKLTTEAFRIWESDQLQENFKKLRWQEGRKPYEELRESGLMSTRMADMLGGSKTPSSKKYLNQEFKDACERRKLPKGRTIANEMLHEIGNEIGLPNIPRLEDFKKGDKSHDQLRTLASKVGYKKRGSPEHD